MQQYLNSLLKQKKNKYFKINKENLNKEERKVKYQSPELK